MNLEMNRLPLNKILYRLQHFASQAAGALRTAFRRPAKTKPEHRGGTGQKPSAGRERYHAEAMAQIQSTRFLR
jgi:hypothetical protein